MESVNNNRFEVTSINSKRKISAPCPNVYLNPGLDILANDDPICNTAMEIVPNKKKKHTKTCDIAAFENSALDLGISKSAVNEFLARELNNVCRNVKLNDVIVDSTNTDTSEGEEHFSNIMENNNEKKANNVIEEKEVDPIYANVYDTSEKEIKCHASTTCNTNYTAADLSEIDSSIQVLDPKTALNEIDISNITNITANITNQVIVNNTSHLNLSFIDKLALDSPNCSNQSLYFDDDLNESNIMEIKTITIITKKKLVESKNTNPFLEPNVQSDLCCRNPFLEETNDVEYSEELMTKPIEEKVPVLSVTPRKLFSSDTNSTISTVNESSLNIESQNEYENIDSYRSESPIYENIEEIEDTAYNKQSKILGCDVSQFSAVDILNLNKMNNRSNTSNESSDSKRDLKHQFFKVGNKLSKKVLKTLRKTFKSDKMNNGNNVSLNPYEVPRKLPKQKAAPEGTGIMNPGLNLDNSDEIEIEEICEDEDENLYETVKTMRNTQRNMKVTPLKERCQENEDLSLNRTNTPSKKVRFDSTLNREKVITGNSFDYEVQSPGFNLKIEKYHDELENCLNERKFIQQNM